jgi:fluoride exporter
MIWDSFLVGVGGFFGAIARYCSNQWIARRVSSKFPYGTLFVNLLGSFLLGLIIGGKWGTSIDLLFGTGFMGAFTTFSTFKVDSLQLGKQKDWKVLGLYLGMSYLFGILLAFLGYKMGAWIKG